MSIVDLKTLIYSKTYTPPYLISHTYIRIFYFHGPLLQYPCSIPKLKNLKNGYIEYFEQLKKNKKKKKKNPKKIVQIKKKQVELIYMIKALKKIHEISIQHTMNIVQCDI